MCTITQITESKDDEELRSRALDMADCLIQCGITRPLTQLRIEDVPSLVQSIALYATVLKVKAALDQFVDGLKEACILTCIQEYPHLFRDLFVKSSTDCLDPGMNDIGKYERLMISLLFLDLIINLFEEKSFSPSGTTANIKEQSTYMFFKEEIICEGAMCVFLYVFSYSICIVVGVGD